MYFRCSIVVLLVFLAVSCCTAAESIYSILSTGKQQPLLASGVDSFPFPDFSPPEEPPERYDDTPPPHFKPPPPEPEAPPRPPVEPPFPKHPPPHSPPPPSPKHSPPPSPRHSPPPSPRPSPPVPIKPPPHSDSPAPSPSQPVYPPPSPSPGDEEQPPPSPHLPAASLASLSISKGKLVPKFSPDVHNYSASVSSGVKKIRITATVPEEYESFEYTITINNIPVKSGAPSPQLSIGKTGKKVVYEICVTALEHESSSYYISVEREKSKWERFGTKFLLALAIILIVVVIGFLCYGCYLCVQSGRIPAFWPFTYFLRDGHSDYTSLGAGPSQGRP